MMALRNCAVAHLRGNIGENVLLLDLMKNILKAKCDCCYPSHTVWGKGLSAQRKLYRGIKRHSILMMEKNLFQTQKNLIDYVGMASILRQVF